MIIFVLDWDRFGDYVRDLLAQVNVSWVVRLSLFIEIYFVYINSINLLFQKMLIIFTKGFLNLPSWLMLIK